MQTESEFDRAALDAVLASSSDPDNPGAEEIHDLVRRTITIAVVGMSRDPSKYARRVPSYLAAKGAQLLEDASIALAQAGLTPEVAAHVHAPQAGLVVDTAAARPERPIIWLQEGIRADQATARARAQGLSVVQDLCLFKVHSALGDTLRRAMNRDPGREP